MTTQTELLREALELADAYANAFNNSGSSLYNPTTAAARKALADKIASLAQPEQPAPQGEAAMWAVEVDGKLHGHFCAVNQAGAEGLRDSLRNQTAPCDLKPMRVLPLYATPPQEKQQTRNRTTVDGGALRMALNVLRRAGKDEVADALEETAEREAEILPASPASPQAEQAEVKTHNTLGELTGCACRWDKDDNRVQTCERHQGWLDVVHDWAERAKSAEQAEAAKPIPLAQQIRESVLLSPVNPPMLRIHGVNAEVLERAAKRWHAADEAAKPKTLSEFTHSDDSTRAAIGARVVDAAVEMQREVMAKPETEREPRFQKTYCSSCGGEFGPGDHGHSHCEDHSASDKVSDAMVDADLPPSWCLENAKNLQRFAAALISADSKDAGEPVAENDEEHPNNKLLFNRMCLHFGIMPGEDSISQALAKIARPQAADVQPLTEEQITMDGLMMTPNDVLENCADAFVAGVRFAERAHGIGKDNAS